MCARKGRPMALLSIPAVAAVLDTTTRHVRSLIRERGLPVVRVGGVLRVAESDLEAWLAARREVRS